MHDADLVSFLAALLPAVQEEVTWGVDQIRLRASYYTGREIPPLPYLTSVRSIVLKGEQVLVLRNVDQTHIIPGGRREEGETLEATLRREVLEETGWEIEPLAVIGFIHYHHLTPKPPEYRYPYPGFLQLVYVSVATTERPEARIADDWENEASFRPIAALGDLAINPGQLVFLRAAAAIAGG